MAWLCFPIPQSFVGLSPNCHCWQPESCLADLECPSGITKPGGSPGLWRASKVLPGTIGREGATQSRLKGQKVGQFPVSLPGGSLFHPPSAGLRKGTAQPPPLHGGLAVTYLSCSSIWRCCSIHGEDRNRPSHT